MPIGLTAGFDMVFAISARTFGAIVDGILRPAVAALGMTGRDIPLPPFGTLFYDDIRADAWLGTTTGNTIEIRFSFFNARLAGPITIPFGPGWSDFFVPSTIGTAPVAGGAVNLAVTFNFATATFDADDEAPLLAANLTEAQIARLIGPAMAAAGIANPLFLTPEPIPLVGLQPAVAAGAAPNIAVVAVAVQRRATAATAGEEALAICLNFQDRPDTPAGRVAGNPAAVPASTFGVGQDLLLEIENGFLFELVASLSLEAPADDGGLGVPPGSVTVTRDAGITLTVPAAVTVGVQSGMLTTFTVTPPAPGTTAMTLGLTFVFELDFITYTVTIAGGTITLGLSGTTIVVGSVIPPATVASVVPVWVSLLRVLGGARLGFLAGGIVGAVAGAVVGAVTVVAETAIVSAIAGPSATAGLGGALAGGGAGLIPAALTELAGGATLSPPLVFDDIRVGGRAKLPDVVSEFRRVTAVELLSGWSLNLDTGRVIKPFDFHLPVGGVPSGSDLIWDSASGLTAGANVRLAQINGRFADADYTDTAGALSGGGNVGIPLIDIPLVSAANLATGRLPRGVVLAIRTDTGRVAKAAAWRDEESRVVLRYVVWDTSAAALRILGQWNRTQTVHDPDTPGPTPEQVMKHDRYAHRARFSAATRRLTAPLDFRWTLAGTPLTGTGSGLIGGTNASWQQSGDTLTLDVALGESLAGPILKCEVTDDNSVTATDTVQLTVAGRQDWVYTPLDPSLVNKLKAVKDALRSWRELPLRGRFEPPNPPDPAPQLQIDETRIETNLRAALIAGNLRLKDMPIKIR